MPKKLVGNTNTLPFLIFQMDFPKIDYPTLFSTLLTGPSLVGKGRSNTGMHRVDAITYIVKRSADKHCAPLFTTGNAAVSAR